MPNGANIYKLIKFKEVLTSDLILTHYDPQLLIMIASDASSTGIGSVARQLDKEIEGR